MPHGYGGLSQEGIPSMSLWSGLPLEEFSREWMVACSTVWDTKVGTARWSNQEHLCLLSLCPWDEPSDVAPWWLGIAFQVLVGKHPWLLPLAGSRLKLKYLGSWKMSLELNRLPFKSLKWRAMCSNTHVFSIQSEQSFISLNFSSAMVFSFPGKYLADRFMALRRHHIYISLVIKVAWVETVPPIMFT